MNINIKRALTGGLLAAAATGAVLVPAQASAANNTWGAISYSPSTDAWGTAINFSSGSDARYVAKDKCGHSDCQVMTLHNNCGALVTNKVAGTWWWAYAPTRSAARGQAMEFAGWSPNAKLQVTTCIGD
ncbi:DUF4189 domain-containing protein [Gordonia sp. TBRC 11910]|uniref:DUF4189 domain-containing protein n=1 Tax=Gordonia asplenii TaxID=2725283 RepID=A0A848L8E4_9ACTN|nr:DUF4189 domain-containing protein [Gordonia asplenii]NMO05023.1 DUF4189 domain-containing protein [Gordonia asplenii]